MKRLLVLPGIFLFLFVSCGTVDLAKRYPNMIANVDPITLGTVEIQFDRLLSSRMNKSDVTVIFYPRLNAVALEFRYEFIRHRQFWDEDNRRHFVSALNRYKADYSERNLIDRYRKTRAVYGKVKGRVEWEAFNFAKTRVSLPAVELGYRFKENAPYFTTYMRSAKEEKSENSTESGESLQVSMYFTRAMADELIKYFDQAYLLEILGSKENSNIRGGLLNDNIESEFDDYHSQ
jgi:hypothetical protein